MKNERRFLERMSEIDDELITRADNSVAANNKRNFHKRLVIIAAAILAVCAVLATAATFYIKNKNQNQHFDTLEDVIEVPISDVFWIDKREKNNNKVKYDSGELGIIFPWNEREAYEKYTEMIYNDEKYSARASYYGEEIFANQIGKMLSEAECSGYDVYDDKSYKIGCKVYEIIGVDSKRFVAVKYDDYDGYFPFIKDKQQAPATLGALIDALNLTENARLNDFYYENVHFALTNENSDVLWSIVKEYSGAQIASEELYYNSSYEVSFAIYSSTIGAHNLAFSISKDGYLRTNIENYAYVYNIGVEGAKKIIEFATKNRLAIIVPQTQYLVGVITEVGENYIKVDDSVIMKNSDEGIEFTVHANRRNKLSAYIKIGEFEVGDTVRVEHSYLAKENYVEINNAVRVHKCEITLNGNVLIPE